MAPYPDSTATPTSPPVVVSTPPTEDSALPGMKRGIAIGVACSVGIIMVALLAFFAYRRRKQQATRHAKLSSEEPVELDTGFWPQEKTRHVHPPPIEADAQTIHELDGYQVPELPGDYDALELNVNKQTPRVSYHEEDSYGQKLKQWNDWNIALDASYIEPIQDSTQHSNPTLAVSPSRPQSTNLSPFGGAMLSNPSNNTSTGCVSPLALSPLEDAHFKPSSKDETRRPRYYDQTRT